MFRLDPRLDWLRGLRAALILGGLGAVAPLVLMLGLTVGGWAVLGATESDRPSDLVWLRSRMLGPTLGIGVLFASTGWAAFAPRRPHRFFPTFLSVCLLSLGGWFVLGLLQLTPRRFKGVDHPLFYPSELLVFLGPPIVAAARLSLRRAASDREPLTLQGCDRVDCRPSSG